MKKIRYYKAIKDGKKIRYTEHWGEPLSIKLPGGNVIKCACEFSRSDGWRITDTATGFLAQQTYIPNKKALAKYIENADYLAAFARIINSDWYKKSVLDLEAYQKQFI